MNTVLSQLRSKMTNKEYRDAFVAEQIFSRLPLKIRGLREQRDLSQEELGKRAGMAQAWVSKLEDPNYGKLTISTLLRLAAAFDVGLHIDFVPFSQILNSATSISEDSFHVPSFAAEREESGIAAVANVPHYHVEDFSHLLLTVPVHKYMRSEGFVANISIVPDQHPVTEAA